MLDRANTPQRKGVYVASKTRHASLWRKLRDEYPIISTWIDEAEAGQTADFSELWARILREVQGAKALVFLQEGLDMCKGAFIEVGAALALGIPVLVVVDRVECVGTWINHPGVRCCYSLHEAFALITGEKHE